MKKYFILAAACLAILFAQLSFKTKDPANKVELGRMLFFDPILSADKTISCSSCHLPAFAFADTARVSIGVGGRRGTRNSPSVMNINFHRSFFWDGRVKTLEDQALEPITNPVEMNLPIDIAVVRLQRDPAYRKYFMEIFGRAPDKPSLAAAISAFERSLETSDTPFDSWKADDDTLAVSPSAKRGFVVFSRKGKCAVCHFGADFTTHEFRNIGLFDGRTHNDSGRISITHDPTDLGKFKVPGLRNIALTAPYMHGGQIKTLKGVIEFYNNPAKFVPKGINRDTTLAKPLGLTEGEKKDLEAFLRSLTDRRFSK